MPFKVKKPVAVDGTDFEGLKSDVRDLAKYVDDEFAEVASALQNPDPMQVLYVAPPKPRAGLIVYADGTHWNPGSGEGLYSYNSGGVWIPLFVPVVPYFSAYLSADQTPVTNGAFVLVNLASTLFDNKGWFDTTNHRYTPQKAGTYFFVGKIRGACTTSVMATVTSLYKNGVEVMRNFGAPAAAGTTTTVDALVSGLIQLNGSTDFVDLRGFIQQGSAGTDSFAGGAVFTYLAGFYIGP